MKGKSQLFADGEVRLHLEAKGHLHSCSIGGPRYVWKNFVAILSCTPSSLCRYVHLIWSNQIGHSSSHLKTANRNYALSKVNRTNNFHNKLAIWKCNLVESAPKIWTSQQGGMVRRKRVRAAPACAEFCPLHLFLWWQETPHLQAAQNQTAVSNALRGLPFSTYAKFSGFLTPSLPLVCI